MKIEMLENKGNYMRYVLVEHHAVVLIEGYLVYCKAVYSKDLESKDKEVKVANEDIPIIKLGVDQKIKLDGKAVIGRGMKSSKFQPCIATYKQLDDKNYDFYVESFGQMTPAEIFKRAVSIINSELKEIGKEMKK